jgi:hypothetical protein
MAAAVLFSEPRALDAMLIMTVAVVGTLSLLLFYFYFRLFSSRDNPFSFTMPLTMCTKRLLCIKCFANELKQQRD